MPPERFCRNRNAKTRADHPYRDRDLRQSARSNNDALQRKSRDREVGAEQHEDDSLEHQSHQHCGLETATAQAAIDHPQEKQQGEQAPAEARAHEMAMSDGEASQFSQDSWVNQALFPPDQEPASDGPGGGDDHSDQFSNDEGHQDRDEEQHTIANERDHLHRDSGITGPGRFDVVCGRGISVDRRPGNQYFRQIVGEYLASYSTAPDNRTKKSITMEIIARIKTSGRFLKEDDHTGRWIEVGDDIARSKIGQQLRYQMRSTNENF